MAETGCGSGSYTGDKKAAKPTVECIVLTNAIQKSIVNLVDIRFELNGLSFVCDEDKATRNLKKHGIRFEEAAEVFFDPYFRLADGLRNGEARDAAIGRDARNRLLYVVHIEIEDEFIRMISARKATREEIRHHDS